MRADRRAARRSRRSTRPRDALNGQLLRHLPAKLPANGTFTAQAEQAAADGVSTPAQSGPVTFTIDTTAPTANITGGPSGR